ncbi:Cytochrome P450 [Glarea lozoyensis ATCC 20868]|uniref:Bifunctional cytochrome P450/NADPH--P450 reductase n=1 Tax=Glarea lozoyensis (strain ATCC 20868 / MF5171) TaxID=1116229 RepID=S3CPA2_GLAL2|nr:Cytochrome P450 [Glarea lozoyensis ATCC 20868]EPE27540.1 Cytochrome P450 [Glarea lozoyensis ATCC 20868]
MSSQCPFDDGSGIAPHPMPPQLETPIQQLPIPQPPTHLFGLLGNIPEMDPSFPARSFWRLNQLYGPIVKLSLKTPTILLSSQEFVNEVCDESRFEKYPGSLLVEVRPLLGDGLFTAFPDEKAWGIAHRTLMPVFGPMGVRKMFDGMLDIACQMVLRWDRLGPDHEIECSDDLTRLVADVLIESGKRGSRPSLLNKFYLKDERIRQENVRKMHDLADQILAERKAHPKPDANDLLNTMIYAVDSVTGEKLTDEMIRYNMCTFLVAGHETTSSTLSFTYYNLLNNPEKLHKAQQEVDEVLGDSIMTVDHIPKFKYIDACLKETLRLSSPINGISVKPKQDTTLGGGRYTVSREDFISVNMKGLHHDVKVWGEDHDEFKPERMFDDKFNALPPNSWKPFGNGARGCIGRGFAWQEMLMNVALVLQRFQIEKADPNYKLELKSTLTIKPWNWRMKVRRRPGKALMTGIPGGIPSEVAQKSKATSENAQDSTGSEAKAAKFTIFFGGNAGTCEGMAQDLQSRAQAHGLEGEIQALDSATENLPTDRPIVIITSSYEGKPPDNAKKFVSWLETKSDVSLLKDVKYAVFGVGNSDWVDTYHRIPRVVDEGLKRLGAQRLCDTGFSNVKEDLIGPWEEFLDPLIESLRKAVGASGDVLTKELAVDIQTSKDPKIPPRDESAFGTVLVNRELASNEIGPAKKHMEIRLPALEGAEHYTAGDYLVVTPRNPKIVVERVISHFDLKEDQNISFKNSKKFFLPTTPISVKEFLFTAVELSTPITKKQVETVVASAKQEQKSKIEILRDAEVYQGLLKRRYSILDILDEYDVDIPLSTYVDMLQPLAARQYSISSSALYPDNNPGNEEHADILSITYDVLEQPALSGNGTFYGVASTYLASRRPGDRIACATRSTNVNFRLPKDPETPVIMIAAGTGIAPMRAFIQERAAIAEAGARKLGPAILFFGCRHADKDFIYKDELSKWESEGIVEVKPAFSKMSDKPVYVQDVIWENREKARTMFQAGGKIFLCGSASKLGKSAADICKKIYREGKNCSEEEAAEWLDRQKEDRYVSDVFG